MSAKKRFLQARLGFSSFKKTVLTLLSSKKTSSFRLRSAEQKRRKREMIGATIAFCIVLVLMYIQLSKSGTGDKFFVILFSINFVMLAGILIVVLRNAIKLLLDSRQKVLGSRLRTRLVLALVSLALVPCLLMFFVTTKFVQISIDFWFKEQTETSMELTLDIGHLMYEKTERLLSLDAGLLQKEMRAKKLTHTSKALPTYLEQKRKDFGISYIGLTSANGEQLSANGDDGSAALIDAAWKEIQEKMNKGEKSVTTLLQGFEGDYFFLRVPLSERNGQYLLLAQNMGAGLKAKIDRISRGAHEYRELRRARNSIKSLLYSSLGVLTAFIILGAFWLAFRLAREISAPVLAVAAGTERIAKGDLAVRIENRAGDELGTLISSFNKMAQDLETSRIEITGINSMLEKQNAKIARHSKYIETVLDNIAAGVISVDAQGYIITLNKAASEILCTPPESLLGVRFEQTLPASHRELAIAMHQKFAKRLETRVQRTLSLPLGGDERQLFINVVGFSTDGEYSGAVIVIEDISEIENMQRVAAWREVARRIAHEIKNPLTPIKLSAERLAKKFGSQVADPAFMQSTELIVKQVEHLQRMVHEFSAFAKMPEVSLQPGRIEPILENLTSLFRNSHAHIKWELHLSEHLPILQLDKEALNRAFMNLLTNAAEALCVQTDNQNPIVYISAIYLKEMRVVRINIADNGPGLTDQERTGIFEPYYSRKKGGTGLGLTIVRSIISDHRGYIRAFHREGGGTIMSIELPLT